MATEMKGVWDLTNVPKSGTPTSKTASYKIKGKEVIKLTNLSSSLEAVDGKIDGLTVDEDNKTVTLSGSALNKQTVAFTSSTYTLALYNVSAVTITPDDPVVSDGKATINGDLSEGYTLSANGKTLTYSEEKENQLLATVSGLSTDADSSNVVYEDGVITIEADALKAAKVSLTLKNGADYTLAIGDEVQPIRTDGTWTVSKGTATLKGTVTQDGYAVAPDGKSINYLKANANTATLATVKGLNTEYNTISGNVANEVDENGNYIITLPAEALNAKDVTISGTGYALALDGGVTTSETAEKTDEWTVSNTTATYNQVMPEHYDVSGAKIAYTKAATVQTYATLKGIKSGLKVSSNKKTIQSDSTDVVTVSDKKVITLKKGALTTSNVTLTSDDYSLALDGVDGAVIDTETGSWSLSGKTGGVYKANITTPGWGQKDSKTITYAKTGSATVGTITGLASGITKDDLEKITVTVDGDEGTFTIPEELLTDSDVTLTNGNGFGYSLTTDAPAASEPAYSWEVADVKDADGNATSATAKLYYGKSAYYTSEDGGITLKYNEPEPGSSVATLQFLKAGISAEDMPANENITKADKAKNYTIPLSADVLTTKTVTLTGSGYVLALDDDNDELSAKPNQLIWTFTDNKKNDTTATLINYKTEGWAPNTGGTQIVYTAPVKGTTLATITGFKSGLKTIGEGEYDEVGDTTKTRVYNNFTGGITVYTEATTEPITGSKTGETEREYAANTIAIKKAAVVDGIKMTSSNYSLAVGKDLTESEATPVWTFDTTKGTATYTYQTPAGYSVDKSGTTSTFNVEKASKLTATLTGLDISDEDAVKALAVDNGEKVITLTEDVLKGETVTVKGNYTLNADAIDEPEMGSPTWNISKKGTATLNGAYTTEGYTLDSKETTLTYTEANDQKFVTLATVSGLGNAKDDAATEVDNDGSAGLVVDDDKVITLSKDILGTSKVTVKGDGYKLALDDDVPKEAETKTAWTVKGTTATLQTSKTGYYTPEMKNNEATGLAIIYNKPGNATVHATVSGLLKDAEIDTDTDYNSTTKTLTLTTDMLGTAAKVTLTDKDNGGYKLALDDDVPTEYKENVSEWSTSGTTATYKNFTKGFYTLQSSDTLITYTKDKDVKTLLTISGLVKDSQITSSNFNASKKTITLTSEQLVQTKDKATATLKDSTGEGYTLKLASGLKTPTADPAWTFDSSKGAATYVQAVEQGDFICNGTTITYYDKEANITLATLTGFNKTAGLSSSNFESGGATVSSAGVITLTSDVLSTDADTKSTKVSVSKGYTLAIDSDLAPETTNAKWVFTNLTKSGTAVYQNDIGAGYVVDAKKTSVSYSAAKTGNAAITLSGLNKNYTGDVDSLTAAAAGITISNDVVTLSNKDLLTTSKITLKNGTGANYTLTVDESLNPQDLDASTAVWTIKSTTATLNLGTSAGYTADANGTTVSYSKEVANTPVATLTNLGKNAKVDGGKLGTLNNKVFTQGVFINQDTSDTEGKTYNISLTPEVLGTSDVKLTNETGSAYTYKLTADNLTAPDEGEKIWQYDKSKGTATLYQSIVAGWTLDSTNNTLKYTAGKDNAALTTLSGLSKTFSGEITTALSTPTGKDDAITIKNASLLGTSKATLKNATKDGYTYTLELGTGVPQTDTLQEKKWLTSGAKASLKDYNQAYYTTDTAKTSITYTAAKDVSGRVYAEVSGIAKDVDISGNVSGNVITLGEDQLDGKTVTLTNKTVDGEKSEYTLALGSDADKATPDSTATWVTKGTTANLTASVSAGFTANSEGTKLTYTKDQSNAVLAVIKGVVSGALNDDTLSTSATLISPATSNLSSVVSIDGKETYAFKFASDYSSSKITGAATADTINAAGDSLNINTGKGDDVVTVSGASVTLTAGDGDDTISISGGNASINAGAGDDSIKSGGGNNTFYYATGNGDDVIANFAPASDKIMTNAKGNVIKVENVSGNAVITIGAGTKNEGTITLTGKGSAKDSIIIVDTKGVEITPNYTASSDVLLADDNYSMNAAAVTDITDAFHASYTPYDFETGLDLVKKDSFTPVVTYTSDK